MNKYIKKDMEIFWLKDLKKIKYFRNLLDNMLKKYKYVCLTENYYDDDSILDRNKRLEFNNWQDEYIDGTWGMNNTDVKKSISLLLKILKNQHKLNNLYVGIDIHENKLIYIYNRETNDKCDYIITFYNKES